MAQKVHLILVDDLDGSTAVETVAFGLDGTSYEIDLSTENATRLRRELEPYIGAGRAVPARRPKAAAATSGHRARHDAAQLRAWARSNGIEVSTRGRVSRALVERYEAALGG